jgi:coenzyme F420-0:L-glutamate ligase/coenzyme F420-1:gamma-L-glutamate ligase
MSECVPNLSVYAAIAGRRSIRAYLADEVSAETVRRLLGAATAAPSAHNRQPWRFLILRDGGGKSRLADAMGQRLRQDRTRDGDDPEAIERDVARSRARITGAPVLFVVCATLEDMDVYPDAARNRAEYLMAVQSTAMAVQNLMIAAASDNLGTCWMCAPLFCPDVVRTALDLPASWEPQGLVALGRPAGPGKLRPRRALEDVARDLSVGF